MFNFLSEKFSSVFSRLSGQSTLTEGNIEQALQSVHDALLEADVPYEVVESFLATVKEEIVGQKIVDKLKPGEQFIKVVHEKLVHFLGGQVGKDEPEFSFQLPTVVTVMGLQGSGKTTFIAKLANYVKEQAAARGKDRSILVASVDFYRPAAVEQLEILAKKVPVSFFRATSIEPKAAAKEIFEHYKANRYELLILDTAGRLHIDQALLEELKAISKSLNPKYSFLVLDGMTGQESLSVAQSFNEVVGFSHAIMTKMDSQTRGGAAFAFRYVLKKPLVFTGVGEKIRDLEAFHPSRIANRILGMGDILSLIEKAEKNVKKAEQEKMAKSMMSGAMSLQDFADQLSMVNQMGSLSSITKYLPGAPKMSDEDMEKGEREIKVFKALIQSMTRKERYYPKILDASRKERIARGAGCAVTDINRLMKRFEQSQQFAKLFKQFGRGFGKGPFG